MKFLSERESLNRLRKIKNDYQSLIRDRYEPRAKNCLTCDVQGVCCTDAHFVNVHITRLEAVAVLETLEKLSPEKRQAIYERISETIEKYDLKVAGETSARTFACPLFEKGTGCLVHLEAKPVPCIQHACYENQADLPPDELLSETENLIENLNARAYGRRANGWLPLPLWLDSLLKNER